MYHYQETISQKTSGPGLYEITDKVQAACRASGMQTGLLTLFIQHTSASLTIQENADPDVQTDLTQAVARLAPADPTLYRHTAEGPDDMPAHIKSALTDVSLSIPVQNGRAALGVWQGIYIFEHRAQTHTRRVLVHLLGD
ncbi:hypothetical protein GCM10017044_07840 [Kordiimonas sediminis]|uniref:YjbQ family protein n=1 Tax=Kordiimonas sediminis TaxID=1735581 RepID=A0A919AM11_9PROT|nr:secondary thiamine-phosphate synthase enzyme YjbQ [Kordiimonas sediminis]GHF16010.1 hypothetical protein GCM10017044_07840 [Kordiimonas sediminis]